MFENFAKPSKALLDVLEQLLTASEKGNFDVFLDYNQVPSKEAEVLRLLNVILNNYKAASERDTERYKLTTKAMDIALFDSIFIKDDPFDPGNILTWSDEFRRLLGCSGLNDFPNVLESWTSRIHPEDLEKTINAIKAHLSDRTGKTPYNIENRMRMKSGEYRVFRNVGTTTRDRQGKPLRIAGAVVDITEIKQLEEQMLQAKELSEKINTYQNTEANDIVKHLNEGLSKGILQFDFSIEKSDEDTAQAAIAYKQIGDTMSHAVTFIKGYVDEIAHLLQEFSNENFDVATKQNYMGDFIAIKQSIDGLTRSIGTLVSDIQKTTAQVEIGAHQISHSTQSLMSSFEEQAAALSGVREAVNTLTDKTHKNAADAQSANGLSEQVQNVANTGSQHMRDMSTVMEEIKISSSEIAKVASIIEGIAFQTNLLALNASVEAARAGDHGKGFAVVAEEVRNLAGRSSEAAKNTSEMIAKSLERVNDGVAKSAETAQALEKIVEVTSTVTDVISNIATVSNEQAEEISRIQNNIEAIHRGADDNISVAQGSASVSEELSSQANVLMSLVNRFKIGRR